MSFLRAPRPFRAVGPETPTITFSSHKRRADPGKSKITALREISILRSLKHQNIIDVIDVAVGAHTMDEVYMVMEYAQQVGNPMPR